MFDSVGRGPAPAPASTPTAPAHAEPEHHVPPVGPFDVKAANDALAPVGAWTTIHDTTALANSYTHGFRTFEQASHLADNATLMGNTAAASRFAGVAARNETGLTSFLENPTVKGVFEGPESLHGFGGLTGIMGGMQLLTAGQELMDPKRRTQGALDGISGSLALASIAQPELAIPAAAAGFIASGNDFTRDRGWWGKTSDGDNRDSVQWTMDNAVGGWNTGRNLGAQTGSRTLTDLGGAVGGTLAGVGSGLYAGAVDLGAGIYKTGSDAVGGLISAGQGLQNFQNELITNPGQAMRDAGNFAGNVWNGGVNLASGAANLAGSAINGIGNAIANPGQTAQNVWNAGASVVQGAGNVIGSVASGAGNVIGTLGSDIAYDAGNLAQGAVNVGSGIVQGAGNVVSSIGQGASNLVGGALNAISGLW